MFSQIFIFLYLNLSKIKLLPEVTIHLINFETYIMVIKDFIYFTICNK